MTTGEFFPAVLLIAISAYIVALFVGAAEMPRLLKRIVLISIAIAVVACPIGIHYSISTSEKCQFGACAGFGDYLVIALPLLIAMAVHLFVIAMRKE